MREIIFFIASLAGAAILTALAVLVRPESPLWRWCLWAGIAIFVACAVVLLIDFVRPGRNVILLVGMGAGVALFLACAIPFFMGTGDETHGNGFYIECRQQLGPIRIPAGGLYFAQISETGGGGLSHLPVTDPSQIGQDYRINNNTFIEAAECKLSNYESMPALGVSLDIEVSFRRIQRSGIVVSEGDIVGQRAIRLEIGHVFGKIDPGPDNSFVFYVANRSSESGVNVEFPKTISAWLLNEDKARSFQLRGGRVPFLLPERLLPK